MKRPVALLLTAIAMAYTAAPPGVVAQDPATVVRLIPSVVLAEPDDLVPIQVWVDRPVSLAGFQFTLAYNPDVADIESIELGPLLGSTGRTPIELPLQYGDGTVTFGAVSTPDGPGVSASGELALITIRAVRRGQTSLRLANTELTNEENRPIEHVRVSGRLLVNPAVYLPSAHKQ